MSHRVKWTFDLVLECTTVYLPCWSITDTAISAIPILGMRATAAPVSMRKVIQYLRRNRGFQVQKKTVKNHFVYRKILHIKNTNFYENTKWCAWEPLTHVFFSSKLKQDFTEIVTTLKPPQCFCLRTNIIAGFNSSNLAWSEYRNSFLNKCRNAA